MTDKELEKKATEWIRSQGWSEENLPNDEYIQMCDAYIAGAKAIQQEIIEIEKVSDYRLEENQQLKQENEQLKIQFDKLLDFVADRTEECDVCELTDTCINSEGVCPFAGSDRNIKDLIIKHINGS